MKYKKVFSGVLIVGLLFTNAVSFATETVTVKEVSIRTEEPMYREKTNETQLSQEEAEKLLNEHIKSFFNIDLSKDKDRTHTYMEFREDWYNNQGIWQLSMSLNERDKYFSVYAVISDDTKELISIRKYEGYREESGSITQFTFDEAKVIAVKFLEEKKPELISSLSDAPKNENYYYYNMQGSQGLYPREYRVFFEREHGGIPFMNEGITIGVNSGTGEVVSYEYLWSDQEVPAKNGIITQEEARNIYKESIDFRLNYQPVTNYGHYYNEPIKEVKLVYSPDGVVGNLINAKNGKLIDQYQQNKEQQIIDVKDVEKESFKNLEKNIQAREKEMSKDQAIKIATEVLNGIYKDVKIEGSNYYSSYGYNNSKTWNIEFILGSNRFTRGRITMDALTAETTSIYYHNWARRELMMGAEDFEPAIEWEEAYRKSIDIIKELYPDKLKNVATEQTFVESIYYMNDIRMQNPEYHFNFIREENEIQFPYNNIRVTFDTMTGELQSLDYRWDDITLSKPEKLIDKDIAINLFMDQTVTELAYGLIPSHMPLKQEKQEVMLVYRNMPKSQFMFYNIDAQTGKVLDHRGMEVGEEKQKLESVSELLAGHWAERELTIMHDNGVIDLQNFNLADVLPKKEVIRIIVNSIGSNYYHSEETELKFTDLQEEDPYYNDIRMAVRQGIIENEEVAFNGEEPVSREELAVMLIKMARLEKLAQVQNIYTLPVEDIEDIDPAYRGHTAIAYGLEIIQGTGVRYEPKEKVTLEQTAVAVYRGFKKLFNILR